MKLCRITIVLSLLLLVHVLFVVFPAWKLLVVLLMLAAKKRYKHLDAYGTARWADLEDVRKAGMLEGKGLILGTMPTAVPKVLPAIAGLLDRRKSSEVACEQFINSLRRVKRQGQSPLVRTNCCHISVFAPTGAGKGVSIVIPFLLGGYGRVRSHNE